MGAWNSPAEDALDDDGLERFDYDRREPDEDTPSVDLDEDRAAGDQDASVWHNSVWHNSVWHKEMGFPDQLGVVRVWVDDDVAIERVRLSLQWRHRLGEQTLQQSFGVVFMLINNYHRLHRRRTLNYVDPDREASEPLSFAALDRLRVREDEIRGRLEALGDGGHPTLHGAETIGRSLSGRVQIKLNLVGQLAGVQFDPAWLPTARVKEISDGVVEAHAHARASFVPAEVVVGERERLVDELTEVRNETLAMMRRGFS